MTNVLTGSFRRDGSGNIEPAHCRNRAGFGCAVGIPATNPATVAGLGTTPAGAKGGIGPSIGSYWPDSPSPDAASWEVFRVLRAAKPKLIQTWETVAESHCAAGTAATSVAKREKK